MNGAFKPQFDKLDTSLFLKGEVLKIKIKKIPL